MENIYEKQSPTRWLSSKAIVYTLVIYLVILLAITLLGLGEFFERLSTLLFVLSGILSLIILKISSRKKVESIKISDTNVTVKTGTKTYHFEREHLSFNFINVPTKKQNYLLLLDLADLTTRADQLIISWMNRQDYLEIENILSSTTAVQEVEQPIEREVKGIIAVTVNDYTLVPDNGDKQYTLQTIIDAKKIRKNSFLHKYGIKIAFILSLIIITAGIIHLNITSSGTPSRRYTSIFLFAMGILMLLYTLINSFRTWTIPKKKFLTNMLFANGYTHEGKVTVLKSYITLVTQPPFHPFGIDLGLDLGKHQAPKTQKIWTIFDTNGDFDFNTVPYHLRQEMVLWGNTYYWIQYMANSTLGRIHPIYYSNKALVDFDGLRFPNQSDIFFSFQEKPEFQQKNYTNVYIEESAIIKDSYQVILIATDVTNAYKNQITRDIYNISFVKSENSFADSSLVAIGESVVNSVTCLNMFPINGVNVGKLFLESFLYMGIIQTDEDCILRIDYKEKQTGEIVFFLFDVLKWVVIEQPNAYEIIRGEAFDKENSDYVDSFLHEIFRDFF